MSADLWTIQRLPAGCLVLDETREPVASCMTDRQAQQIVREHNSYPVMLAALIGLHAEFEQTYDGEPWWTVSPEVIQPIINAIAKARLS